MAWKNWNRATNRKRRQLSDGHAAEIIRWQIANCEDVRAAGSRDKEFAERFGVSLAVIKTCRRRMSCNDIWEQVLSAQ